MQGARGTGSQWADGQVLARQYADADSLPAGREWTAVVDAVRSATSQAIADHGALILTARVGALVCR